MSDVTQKLEAIRKKFVGTGEEHDLLSQLTAEYRTAYDRGYAAGSMERTRVEAYENDAYAFAQILCDMNGGARCFIQPDSFHVYGLQDVADWLKSQGKTAQSLRTIADLMDASPHAPPKDQI